MRLRTLALSIALLALPFPLLADTVYTYTGNPFSPLSLSGPVGFYTTSDFVSGSFTVSAPLGADLALASITPAAFSFSDGVNTLTNTSPLDSTVFLFSTDAAGDITGWEVSLLIVDVGRIVTANDNNGDMTDFGSTMVDPSIYNRVVALGESVGNPGVWSSSTSDPSAVPEPSTFLMLATGFGGAFMLVRRRLLS